MLEFYVEGQSLRRGDRERLVAGSVGFVEFSLRFDPSWDGYTKTALFRNTAEEDTYCVFGVENGGRYALPHEVLKTGSEVEVCIFGAGENASCATVNSVRIPVEPTMAKGELKESLQPSPSLFEQLCSLLRDTLRKLPGKNLMLKADEETLWWKSREDELWEPLVSMDSLRGEDGTRWFSSEEAAQEAAEGDYLFSAEGDVFRREGGEWRLFAPLGSAVRRAEKAADEVRRLTESPNLFPEAFELWNGDGAIIAELGQEIGPSVMEPMATYRLPVTPGKSYAFTATPAGTPSLAVTDGDGICLEIKEESVDFLELPFRYGGAVPAYLYYVVRDLNDTGEVFFCEKGIGALEARLSEVEENREILSNALKGKKEGAELSLSDVSPLEHTMKVQLKSETVSDFSSVSLQVGGKNLLTAQQVYEGCSHYEKTTLDGRNAVKMSSGKTVQKAPIQFQENTQYTVSFETKTINNGANAGNTVFTFWYTDGTYSNVHSSLEVINIWKRITATSKEGKTVSHIGVNVAQWKVYDYIDVDTFQFEIGTTATDYEPYREPVSYTPKADGTVEGVKSLYPTILMMSDTEGVVIEAEYNRDLNKAYLDLLGRVAALEGSA